MTALLLISAALAGWVDAGREGPAREISLDISLGEAALIRVHPERAVVSLTEDGVSVPLTAGPRGTWVVPASDRSRTLTLEADRRIRVQKWEEDDAGEPAAWSRYATDVAEWCRGERLLPEPPGELEGLDRVWLARRSAMRETGYDDPRFCTAAAWLELEQVRARGLSDHFIADTLDAEVKADGVFRGEVRGPGVLVVHGSPILGDADAYGPVELRITVDGILVERLSRRSGPNPDRPGFGWRRTAEVVLPPGTHRVSVTVLDGPTLLETHVERMRLPVWRRSALDALYEPQGEIASLESSALTLQADAWSLATPLLDGAFDNLAQYRWVAGNPDQKAVAIDTLDELTPLGRLSWSHRSALRRDLLAERLVNEPLDWTVRVEDVAVNLELLEPSAVRPRDAWARRLAQQPVPGGATTRWTSVFPAEIAGVVRSETALGGIVRVRIDAGDQAFTDVEDDANGLGRLRLLAEEPTRYRVNGEPRYGLGRLDEAVIAGTHELLVDSGTLWAIDGSDTVGGTPLREVPVSALPGEWALPEPGFPARIAISTSQADVPLIVGTDDGRAWTVRTTDHYSVIEVGPFASQVYIRGPDGVTVAMAMERAIEPQGLSLPQIGEEPVEALRYASQRLVLEPDIHGVEEAYLRLTRASALVAMGLTGSARRELSYISSLPDINEGQRVLASTTLTAGLNAETSGPLTAEAALAFAGRLPPENADAEGWLRAAESLPPETAYPVFARAAELLLEQGRAYEAWTAATRGGVGAEATGKAVLRTGRWRRVSRVDQHGGAIRETLTRSGPDVDASPAAIAREVMLGAPWPSSTYAVLRGTKRDRLEFVGASNTAIHLLCQDEAMTVGGPDCRVDLQVDDVERMIRVRRGRIRTVKFALDSGTHTLTIDPRETATNAVVVRVERDGVVIPPKVDVVAHRIGGGVRTAVAGPALIRVRVQRGGPVTVRLGEQEYEVVDEIAVATLEDGSVPLAIDGPSTSWVDIARWEVLPPELAPPPLPEPVAYVAPEAVGPLALASRDWIGEVRRGTRIDRRLAGPPGTLRLTTRLENDAIGERDLARSYRALHLDMALMRVLAPKVYGEVGLTGRASLDGTPAAGVRGRLWRTGGRTWFELGARAWTAGDASHARVDGEWLQRLAGNVETRADFFVAAFGGLWSRSAPARVDPRAWTRFGKDHPWGLAAGGQVTWRPASDARLRGRLLAVSNSEATVDRVEARLTGNLFIRERLLLTGSTELGVRFRDRHRARTNWRPAVRGSAEYALWPSASQRVGLRLNGAWLPLGKTVEGGLSLTWDISRSRGMLDYPIARTVFRDLRDFPQERR